MLGQEIISMDEVVTALTALLGRCKALKAAGDQNAQEIAMGISRRLDSLEQNANSIQADRDYWKGKYEELKEKTITSIGRVEASKLLFALPPPPTAVTTPTEPATITTAGPSTILAVATPSRPKRRLVVEEPSLSSGDDTEDLPPPARAAAGKPGPKLLESAVKCSHCSRQFFAGQAKFSYERHIRNCTRNPSNQ